VPYWFFIYASALNFNFNAMKRIVIVFFLLLSMNYARSQYFESCDNGHAPTKSVVSNEQKIKKSYDGFLNSMPNSKTNSSKIYKKGKENNNDFLSKFYIKLYGGYGFFTPGSYRVQSTTSVFYKDQNNVAQSINIQTQSKKGIGGGLRFGGGITIALNDFLNIGIDAEYQKGTKITNSLFTGADLYNYNGTDGEIDYKTFTLTPHIIFKALAKPKYFIYNKLGILFTLPFTMNNTGDEIFSESNSWPPNSSDSSNSFHFISSTSYKTKYKISLGIGFNVAFGINFRLSDRMRIFGEVFGNFSALSPARSTTNSINRFIDSSFLQIYDNNSSSFYYQLYTSSQVANNTINTTYKKSGGTTNAVNYVSGTSVSTATDQKFTINMNAIGINVGITYRFK
jgi:hypothetical protein